MPSNLNALIRYKAIDACLKNRYVNCTLKKLQEACTDALGEKRGIYKKVSKRTIQDDIRVMRSDILGFYAPILVKEGVYYYADENYSIFNVPLDQKALLKDVLNILTEDNRFAKDVELERLVIRIATLIGENVSEFKIKDVYHKNYDKKDNIVNEGKDDYEPDIRFMRRTSTAPSLEENLVIIQNGIAWRDIFDAL